MVGKSKTSGGPAETEKTVGRKDKTNAVGTLTGGVVAVVLDGVVQGGPSGVVVAKGPQDAAADKPFDYEAAGANDSTPGMTAVWRRMGALSQGGDRVGAVAEAQRALAQHPEDKDLFAFVQMNKMQPQTRVTQKTVSDRAKELMANLRGDPGEAPPGSALTSSPALASAISFPALGASGAPRALTPAALAEMGHRDTGLRLADPLVRSAVSKFMVRDLPGAEALLDRRLEQNPSDEPALRWRALIRRQLGRYEPSAHDAKGALALAPWDAR